MKTRDAYAWASFLIIILGKRDHLDAVWEVTSYRWLDGMGIFHERLGD